MAERRALCRKEVSKGQKLAKGRESRGVPAERGWRELMFETDGAG